MASKLVDTSALEMGKLGKLVSPPRRAPSAVRRPQHLGPSSRRWLRFWPLLVTGLVRRLVLLAALAAVSLSMLHAAGGLAPRASARRDPEIYRYRIVAVYPHDRRAFTQGLEFGRDCPGGRRGNCTEFFWESVGMHGESAVRQVAFPSGQVMAEHRLPDTDFGEGLTRLGSTLYQVTWKSPRAWVYQGAVLGQPRLVHTPLSDGWGATNDGTALIISNSSHVLSWVDPGDLSLLRQVPVTDGGAPVPFLNEMEWMDGRILANIWNRECLARIDPKTGRVDAWIDLQGITKLTAARLPAEQRNRAPRMDVLNGVAWDAPTGRLFVTGKRWPALYEVELVPVPGGPGALQAMRQACIVTDTSAFFG